MFHPIMLLENHLFMQRALDLARLGEGSVSPNPMVGAVLVYDNLIIGEGWHQRYGEAHAEVNAIRSVAKKNILNICQSTLYVSLEPCCVHGNTPPCTDLIIEKKIKKVVIASIDKSPKVDGKGVAQLRAAGVEVLFIYINDENNPANYRNYYVQNARPYVILKFAQTNNGMMGDERERLSITNSYTKRLTHRWRSASDAILIGANTLKIDNPLLTNRHYFGKNPLRILVTKNINILESKKFHLLADDLPTLIVCETNPNNSADFKPNKIFFIVKFDQFLLRNLLKELKNRSITTLLVEGGRFTLQQFIDQNLWNEMRILESQTTASTADVGAPLPKGKRIARLPIGNDVVNIFVNTQKYNSKG